LPSSEEKTLGTNPLKVDTDGDGIPDAEEVSGGDSTGSAKDSDGDGIIDALDTTVDPDLGPEIPPEPKPTTKTEEKSDKSDKVDKDTENKPASDEVTIEPVKASSNTSIQGSLLYFPFRSAEPKLSKSASKYFTKVANWLKESTHNKVVLTGHTDNIGAKAVNKKLGLKRAAIIKKMLIKQGAPNKQIKIKSKGETQPLKTNKTEAGRKKNRRVELTPIGKGAKQP